MEVLNHLIMFFSEYGYFAVFMVLVACGFGLPIPEDISLIAGGVICSLSEGGSLNHLNINIMVVVGLIGVLSGDSSMFLLGSKLGSRITRVPGLKHLITPEIYAKIQEKVHRYGVKILFIARFLPGLRAPIFVTAGISHKVKFWKFILLDGSAALISVPVWVYAGYFFAHDLNHLLELAKKSQIILLSGIVIIILFLVMFHYLKKRVEN
jgi:membrane protein DedA with SNARE-associated domain